MRKAVVTVVVTLTVIFIAALVLPFGCAIILIDRAADHTWKNLTVEQLAELIELDELPECEMLFNDETHGGFLGDGHTAIMCSFESEQAAALENLLAAAKHWSPLPMDTAVAKLFYEKKPLSVQPIENGWYFFFDKQTDSYTVAGDFEDRYSSNYRISAYDSDNMLLFYYGLDT